MGRNQPRLQATDLEHANAAKQRVIASGSPGRERFNPCVWLSGIAPQTVLRVCGGASKENGGSMEEEEERHPWWREALERWVRDSFLAQAASDASRWLS